MIRMCLMDSLAAATYGCQTMEIGNEVERRPEAKAEAQTCTLADLIREEQERDKRLN